VSSQVLASSALKRCIGGSLPRFDLARFDWVAAAPQAPAVAPLVKRAMDVILAAVGLAAAAPLLAIVAFLIKLDSRGPAFYLSRRAGRQGRTFLCYKLRTMVAGADEMKDSLRLRNERQGPFFKVSNDPRITRLGRILRRYSLDELPQLWNVLKGEMSLVGPRPHPLDDLDRYAPEHLRRLEVTPGLTGLWQVTARRDPSFQRNVQLDLEYIENWSLMLDLRILYRTVPAVFQGTGV